MQRSWKFDDNARLLAAIADIQDTNGTVDEVARERQASPVPAFFGRAVSLFERFSRW